MEEFKIVRIQKERNNAILNFVHKYFTPRETLISKCKFSFEEIRNFMINLTEDSLKFDISFEVIHVPTQEIAGVCLMKILTKELTGGYEGTGCTNDAEEKLLNILIDIEKAYDVFSDPEVKKVLECTLLVANPKFSGKGVSYKAYEKCEQLGIEQGCTVGFTQCTGPGSQHIFTKCGYKCVGKVFYNSLQLDGEPLDKSDGTDGPFIGLYIKDLKK